MQDLFTEQIIGHSIDRFFLRILVLNLVRILLRINNII
jgi:hypothetical protein